MRCKTKYYQQLFSRFMRWGISYSTTSFIASCINKADTSHLIFTDDIERRECLAMKNYISNELRRLRGIQNYYRESIRKSNSVYCWQYRHQLDSLFATLKGFNPKKNVMTLPQTMLQTRVIPIPCLGLNYSFYYTYREERLYIVGTILVRKHFRCGHSAPWNTELRI